MAVKKQISQREFENLCRLQCTKLEMCEGLQITDKTLDRWIHDVYGADMSFSEVFNLKRQQGVTSMRRNLYKMSKNNFNALRFWMINHGGMVDRSELITNGQSTVEDDAMSKSLESNSKEWANKNKDLLDFETEVGDSDDEE